MICTTVGCGRPTRALNPNSALALCKRCQDKKNRDIRKANGSQEYWKEHLACYGLTIEQYEKMLLDQNGVCAICGKSETKTNHKTGKIYRLSVDHDHKTENVRALLCCKCNAGLAKFKESIDLVKSAMEYLKNA